MPPTCFTETPFAPAAGGVRVAIRLTPRARAGRLRRGIGEDDDRRFWIWEVSRHMDQTLANALSRLKFDTEGRATLLHHLLHLDLL